MIKNLPPDHPAWFVESNHELLNMMCENIKFKSTDMCVFINFAHENIAFMKHIFKCDFNYINIAIATSKYEAKQIKFNLNLKVKRFDYIIICKDITDKNQQIIQRKIEKLLNKIYKKLGISSMKFDKIIMNPPYDYNLHLQILAKAIEQLTDDGICVNLSPTRWLEDPLAKYKQQSDFKKFENSIVKYINDVNKIPAAVANKIFNISHEDLGIYVIKKDTDVNSVFQINKNSIVEKIIKYSFTDNVSLHATKEGPNQNYVGSFGIINSHLGDLTNFVTSTEKLWNEKRYTYTSKMISFSNDNEMRNFFKSYLTNCMRYYAIIIRKNRRIPWQFCPWMGDCINPRTGLKGYESEWTDEDFYEYFGITKEEQELIEKTIEKYD